MAIINATQTTTFIPEYSENLFSNASNFDNEPIVNVTNGSMTSAYSDASVFDGGKAIFLQPTSYDSTDIVFNFGTTLQYTAKNTGSHIFSIRLLNPNTTVMFFVPFVMKVKLWKNAVNTDEFVINSVSDLDTYSNKWVTWAQSFQANLGDVIDFSFQIDADLSYPFPNINFWMDALKLEYDDRFLGTPSIYSKPLVEYIEKGATGWESKTDTTNIISLTAATDNVMTLVATSDSNGGLTLLDANSKIIPIQLNDVLSIEFACTFVTPAGTEQSIDVYLRVGTNFYRGYNYKLTKGAGNNDFFSINWNLPCGVNVMANDVEIILNPTSTMNYMDRYISVTRIHKAL